MLKTSCHRTFPALILSLVLVGFAGSAITQTTTAGVQSFPEDSPQYAVQRLLKADFEAFHRGDDMAAQRYKPVIARHGELLARKPWEYCSVRAYVRGYSIAGVEHARKIGIPDAQIDPERAFVVVRMEMIGYAIQTALHKDEENRRCGWLGLKTINPRTGQGEHFFDELDDPDRFIAQLAKLGTRVATVEDEYLSGRKSITGVDTPKEVFKVHEDRAIWEFGIPMYFHPQFKHWIPETPFFPQHRSYAEALKAEQRMYARSLRMEKLCEARGYPDSLAGCKVIKRDVRRGLQELNAFNLINRPRTTK